MKKSALLVAGLMLVIFSCKKEKVDDKDDNTDNTNNTPKTYTISGVVQKGPFISGTDIELNELSSSFVQTGKSFKSTILDDKGSFKLKDITLTSNYVLLSADGYYFNEVSGATSSGKLNLQCIADLNDSTTINVNIITHLQKERMLYLIEEESKTFEQARIQSALELLNIFSITMPSGMLASLGDISHSGEVNGIILAIAVVLQGNNNTAELIEFLSNFSTDIREDGILNSPSLQSKLINSAKLLNTAAVRTNIENKYTDLGVTSAVIPDFETYVQEFIDNTSYVFTSIITYPSTSKYGENLLKVEDTTDASIAGFLASGLAVELPVGTSLQLKMTRESGTGHWFYSISYSEGWKINTYDFVANTQVFESTASGTIDMAIDNEASGITKIEIFENGSLTPTRVKYVKWHE